MLKRTLRVIKRRFAMIPGRWRDSRVSTYGHTAPDGPLHLYLGGCSLHFSDKATVALPQVADYYIAHYFDLLGSGWVRVRHGMDCHGLEGYRYEVDEPSLPDTSGKWLEGKINPANLSESKRLWSLVDADYVPIDWHLDFKSGYRWREDTWYRDIIFVRDPGADIKVPWELARMQHLPQLALCFALAKKKGSATRASADYIREFRNQVLDFISTNPPRFGVNWSCTMDVSIRVANWLLAYNLFLTHEAEFDPEFDEAFKRSIVDHGRHIISNLEWYKDFRSNHYLANISGLLFAAAYLPETHEFDSWLAFAVKELIKEVERQFSPDGTNFEASTSYHRLSAEMVTFSTALVLGLSQSKRSALLIYDHENHRFKPALGPTPLPHLPLQGDGRLTPFPDWYFDRMEKMAEFSTHITKPNGNIVQVGDNDSGRFFKLNPPGDRMTAAEARKRFANLEDYSGLEDDEPYWAENHLDHRHLVAAINTFFERPLFRDFAGNDWLAADILRCLKGDVLLQPHSVHNSSRGAVNKTKGEGGDWDRILDSLDSSSDMQQQCFQIPASVDLLKGMRLYEYRCFGIFIYASDHLHLAIRCGPQHLDGNGGHAHNDQLSCEINIDGDDLIADPGTYLYTPIPELRNKYRSVNAHFAPQLPAIEPGRLDMGLFRLGNEAKAECLFFGEKGFIGTHQGYGVPIFFVMQVRERNLHIKYYAPVQLKLARMDEMAKLHMSRKHTPLFSGGYGLLHG